MYQMAIKWTSLFYPNTFKITQKFLDLFYRTIMNKALCKKYT
jgi:hypothetical protein